MRKSFFQFGFLKMGSFGSKELIRLHLNLFQSQNYDEEILVKPDNFHFITL